MTTTETRRRNLYTDSCCVCRNPVAAGEGWLYTDTRTSRINRNTGRFTKKVKCDRCHQNGLTNGRQVEEMENPKPKVKKWSVGDVNRWEFEVATQQTQVAGRYLGDAIGYEWTTETVVDVFVTVGGERVQLAGSGFLGHQFTPNYELEWQGIGGRPFTPAAFKRLVERVEETIAATAHA